MKRFGFRTQGSAFKSLSSGEPSLLSSRVRGSGCHLSFNSVPVSTASSFVFTKRRYAYIHFRDAKVIEEKYLKHITPEGKDPWEHNKGLIPEFPGIKGDKDVKFESFKGFNDILDSFMENMVYPHLPGYRWTSVPLSHLPKQDLYHWNDDQYRYPPVIVLRMQGYGVIRRWIEINWRKAIVRCYTEIPDTFVEADQERIQERMEKKRIEWSNILAEARGAGEEGLAAAKEKVARLIHEENMTQYGSLETGYRTDYSEAPIPPNWLLEFKKHKWPASVRFSKDVQSYRPIGHTVHDFFQEATDGELLPEENNEIADVENGVRSKDQSIVPRYFRAYYDDDSAQTIMKW